MTATATQRNSAKNDPRIARKMVGKVKCDGCSATSITFMIDGVTTRFACAACYLKQAKARQAAAGSRRRSE